MARFAVSGHPNLRKRDETPLRGAMALSRGSHAGQLTDAGRDPCWRHTYARVGERACWPDTIHLGESAHGRRSHLSVRHARGP